MEAFGTQIDYSADIELPNQMLCILDAFGFDSQPGCLYWTAIN